MEIVEKTVLLPGSVAFPRSPRLRSPNAYWDPNERDLVLSAMNSCRAEALSQLRNHGPRSNARDSP